MKEVQLSCGTTEKKYSIIRKGVKVHILKSEAAVIEWLMEDVPIKQKIQLLNLKDVELEEYLNNKRKFSQEYCIKLLDQKWYSRETDEKLKKTQVEFEELEFKTFSEIRALCRLGRLSIVEMNKVIEHFTHDYSEWYLK